MSITVATLVSNLNSDLVRSETSTTILRWLKTALRELCSLIPALKKSTTFTLVATQAKYTTDDTGFPSDLRDIISIRLHNGTDYGKPLTRFSSWTEYLKAKAGQGSGDVGEPEQFIFHNKELYLDATPDALYTYVAHVKYTAISVDTDTIELDDNYEDAIQFALNYFYLVSKGLAKSEKGETFGALYLRQATNLAGIQESLEGPRRIQETDL